VTVLGVFAAVLVVSAVVLPLPAWVPALYATASLVTLAVYAIDKSAAMARRRRVPERALLVLGVIGGWPGAVVAQQALRHKTQKTRFVRAFWFSVTVNVAAFAALSWPLFLR
jgi:uncharacterized membrane protein YsdA (DUF1294 family)